LKRRIDTYCIVNRDDLETDTLTNSDWTHLEAIHDGLKLFYDVTLLCEGHGTKGHHGSIWEALPLLELLLEHTEKGRQREYAGTGKNRRHTPLGVAFQQAWEKLRKYYVITDQSYEIYAAATLLNPTLRMRYFDEHWIGESAEYKKSMLETLRTIWETRYKQNASNATPVEVPDVLESFLKRPTTTPGDQFDQYVHGPATQFAGRNDTDLLYWWHSGNFPQLRQMAFDVLSIPAMSSEIERQFSHSKRMITSDRNRINAQTLEMSELLRDWWKKDLISLQHHDLSISDHS
jgi:hypothetical protein